jgi:negative regulator of flagellin synthesis FlgM
MSSFEIGASRPVGAVQVNAVSPAANGPAATGAASGTAATSATPEVATSLNASAGTAPVDQDRVNLIRDAVQNGNYPVVPTKIGDAMIAAGVMLRKAS